MITAYQKYRGLQQDNQWVYNINIVFEGGLLFCAGMSYLKMDLKRNILFSLLFSGILIAFVGASGIRRFSVLSYMIESLAIVLIYSVMLFFSFGGNVIRKIGNPDIWISVGILFYFAGNLPYFSLFNFLNQFYLSLSNVLHHSVTETLGNIRYVFLAVAFWLVHYNTRNKKVVTYE